MTKASKVTDPNIAGEKSVKTDEFAIKAFAKSGYPKTVKDNIKLVINFFINFLS